MTVTSPKIIIYSSEGSMAMDDVLSAASSQSASVCDLDDFINGTGADSKYATYEPSLWLLDGNYKLIPEGTATINVGYLGSEVSPASSDLATPAVLTLVLNTTYNFEENVIIEASTLNYMDDVDIAFYNSSDVLITTLNLTPTSSSFTHTLVSTISAVKKIVVTMNSTNIPYRRVRLISLKFDALIFTGSDVTAGTLTEEIDPTALTLPHNTLEFTLFSSAGAFDIVNPTGFYAGLTKRKKIDAYETIDGTDLYLGRFYLTDWNAETKYIMSMVAVDALSVLDVVEFELEDVGYTEPGVGDYPLDSSDLLAEIMTGTGIGYSIPTAISNVDIFGTMPISTIRKAIQDLCFRLEAFATCSRSKLVEVKSREYASDITTPDIYLTTANSAKGSISMLPVVTGMDIDASNWVKSNGATQVEFLNDTFAIGSYKVIVGKKLFGVQTYGTATYAITNITSNSVEFNVTAAGTVRLTEGQIFMEAKRTSSYTDPALGANDYENRVKVEDGYLLRTANADTIAQHLWEFFDERYLLKTRLYANSAKVGDSVKSGTDTTGYSIYGIITMMRTDLVRGFVSDVEIRGISDVS